MSDPGIQKYPTEAIINLIKTSTAGHSDSIKEFTENSAKIPNEDLRQLVTSDTHRLDEPTAELLQDLYSQNNCEARYAFRTYFAPPEAAGKLTTPGVLIADFGIQSASIHLPHAEKWQLEHLDEATKNLSLFWIKTFQRKIYRPIF